MSVGGRDKDVEALRRAEIARYLQRLVSSAGYESQSELARELNRDTGLRINPSSISHWLNPKSERGISAYHLFSVVRAAERRKAGVSALPADDPFGDRLQALEAKVDAAGAESTRAIRALAKDVRALMRRLDDEDHQAKSG